MQIIAKTSLDSNFDAQQEHKYKSLDLAQITSSNSNPYILSGQISKRQKICKCLRISMSSICNTYSCSKPEFDSKYRGTQPSEKFGVSCSQRQSDCQSIEFEIIEKIVRLKFGEQFNRIIIWGRNTIGVAVGFIQE